MSPWRELLLVVVLGFAGATLGRWFGRRAKPFWLLGCFFPLLLILLQGLARQRPALAFVPPFSWMMLGRNKFAITACIITMLLTTPLSRLRRSRERNLVIVLMVLMVVQVSVWPCLAPIFDHSELAALTTRIGHDGVCRQCSDYDCGPAAAVTILRKLGYSAEEGEIAVLSFTSSAEGTEPDIMAEALRKRYGQDGLQCEYRSFTGISELKAAGLTLAVIKSGFIDDHFVAVLQVTDKEVIVGDPIAGLTTYSHEDFRQRWRFSGIVLRRTL